MKEQIEKQAIEEMADDIYINCPACLLTEEAKMIARFVIEEQGYRKQSEIIDEFAERIKKYFTDYPEPCSWLEIAEEGFCKGIDELVAEMKGGAE